MHYFLEKNICTCQAVCINMKIKENARFEIISGLPLPGKFHENG